nr:DegT/DnrJ/EryC1/StrS family aminotransferase [Butyrivibrio sp.]
MGTDMDMMPAIEGGKPVREEKLYYSHQDINDKDIEAVVEVLKSNFLTTGPKITEMEKKICEVSGAKYAVA